MGLPRKHSIVDLATRLLLLLGVDQLKVVVLAEVSLHNHFDVPHQLAVGPPVLEVLPQHYSQVLCILVLEATLQLLLQLCWVALIKHFGDRELRLADRLAAPDTGGSAHSTEEIRYHL